MWFIMGRTSKDLFPGQAITLRGSGPALPFGRGSLPNVVIYSNGFVLKWTHLMSIPTQAALWRCKWATKHKCDSVSCHRLPGSKNIHTHPSALCKMCCFTRCASSMFQNYQWISKRERPPRFFLCLWILRLFIRKAQLTFWRSHGTSYYLGKLPSDSNLAHLIKPDGSTQLASGHIVSRLKKNLN